MSAGVFMASAAPKQTQTKPTKRLFIRYPFNQLSITQVFPVLKIVPVFTIAQIVQQGYRFSCHPNFLKTIFGH